MNDWPPDCPTPGKIGYPTEARARAAVRGLVTRGGIRKSRSQRRGVYDTHMAPYRCARGAWHVGSESGRPR